MLCSDVLVLFYSDKVRINTHCTEFLYTVHFIMNVRNFLCDKMCWMFTLSQSLFGACSDAVVEALRSNRKVAGLIPDGVTGFFHLHNPSGRTMAPGWTQPRN
jgi:hypothetical protein